MSAEMKEQLQKIMPDAVTGTVTKATSPIVNNLEASINGACILLKCLVNTKFPILPKTLISNYESIAPIKTSILEIEEHLAGSDATQPPVWEYLVMTTT